MKKYLEYIKENINSEEGQYVIFKDIIDVIGYDACVDFLNKNAINKRVFFISEKFGDGSSDYEIYKNNYTLTTDGSWKVIKYIKSNNPIKIHVIMDNTQSGTAIGLIYLDPISIDLKKYKRIRKPEIDPYDEEDWGYSVQETKKNENLKILNLRGIDDSFQTSILNLITFPKIERERDLIINLINRNVKGKKVLFYNIRDGKNTKKERICLGGYWGYDEYLNQWNFYIVGTKKDYLVDIRRPIGYYAEQEVKTEILNAELDPYGEEDWL